MERAFWDVVAVVDSGSGETKPLIPQYWAWANKEHTRFRTKCRACTNFDSKISHRIHYEERKQRALSRQRGVINE